MRRTLEKKALFWLKFSASMWFRKICDTVGTFESVLCTIRLALVHSARINVYPQGIRGIQLVNIYPGILARSFSHPSSAYASINAYPNVFNPKQWVAVMWKSMSTFSQIDSVEWRHLPPASGNSTGNHNSLYYPCIHSHNEFDRQKSKLFSKLFAANTCILQIQIWWGFA